MAKEYLPDKAAKFDYGLIKNLDLLTGNQDLPHCTIPSAARYKCHHCLTSRFRTLEHLKNHLDDDCGNFR